MTLVNRTGERRGWGHAWISNRIHLFILIGDSRASMCGDYLFRRWVKTGRNNMSKVGPNDCAECWKAVIAKGPSS